MENNINDIVSRVLQSPELRSSLENTVRSLNPPQNVDLQRLPRQEESTSIRQELNRLFPSIRSNSINTNQNSRKSQKRKRDTESWFNRDVILLNSPSTVTTLKGTKKSRAYETGFALSNVEFNSNWTHEEILRHVAKLFNQLADRVFEIMLPIAGRLVKPSLPPDKKLGGLALKTIFNQKVIYIRPFEAIIATTDPSSSHYEKLNISDETTLCHDILEAKLHEDVYEVNEMQFQLDTEQAIKNSVEEATGECNTSLEAAKPHKDDFEVNELQIQLDTEQAIENSDEKTIDVYTSLEQILSNLKNKIKEESTTQFNIYREDIFNCCIRALRRKTFCPFNKISVKFSDIEGNSEGAVDIGGPTREMFRLVINYIQSSKLFFGQEKKYISLNREALEGQEYFHAGRLISLSLIHGGPGPHFFSETLYSVIVFGFSNTKPSISDIEDELKEKITKIHEISDFNLLQEYIIEEPIFSIAGCQFIKSVADKDKIFEDVLKFYVFHRTRPALDQFRDGLKLGGMLDLMTQHPNMFKDIMCNDSTVITATVLENLFHITFSETGSNKRATENRIISFWRDFLIDCEENESEVTPNEILIFTTGADRIPPLGFEWNPRIIFLHDENNLYPKANTCGLELHLPTIHKTYGEFKYHISFGIGNSKDFAFA